MGQNSRGSWSKVVLYLLILASLVVIGLIGYVTTIEPTSYIAVSYITSVLITVSGILLGLSGLVPAARSLERVKLQATFTIFTILWLAFVIVIAQTEFSPFLFRTTPDEVRYLFLAGIGLFTILVVTYSTATVEATRQRLAAEQSVRENQKGRSA